MKWRYMKNPYNSYGFNKNSLGGRLLISLYLQLFVHYARFEIVAAFPFLRIKQRQVPSASVCVDKLDLFLSVPVHEFFHAVQGFLDLAVLGGVAHAGKPITAGTKRIAGYDRHMFFTQQFLGKVLIIHA